MRKDDVPAEPVARALKRWLLEHGLNNEGAPGKGSYISPYGTLASRTGLKEDTLYSYMRGRHESMRFDVADRILTAIEQADLWWHDPELAEVYERACQGADAIYPIVAAA